MKKTMIALILAGLLLLMPLSGCGSGSNNPTTTGSGSQSATKGTAEQTKAPESETKAAPEDWGVGPQSKSLLTTETTYMVYIRFPQLLPNRHGTGYVAKQEDKTLVILDSRHPERTEVEAENVDLVLDTYIGQTERILRDYRNSYWKDFEFEITSREHMTINGYEMCKYIGVLHCSYKGNPEDHFFAAYSSEVNNGNDYVYWMVMDDSEDQSLHEIAEYNADQMAKTLEG